MKYNQWVIRVLQFLRRVYGKIIGRKRRFFFNQKPTQYISQASSDIIKKYIESDAPCMIARFGSVELDCLDFYKISKTSTLNKYIKYIKGDIDSVDWQEDLICRMQNNAGFFPVNNENLERFSELILNEIKNVDVLGSWLDKENNFNKELSHVKTVKLLDLEPYYHEDPWSSSLKGKTVLIIHPFVDSIEVQYSKRDLLFKNKDVLPDFNLKTYKPIQSLAGNHENIDFCDWFQALEFMKNEINAIEFDIAIIGCGAYGFPLASFIKKMGKKSIHLGGATQILFGIIGKRWELEYDMSNFFNENWIRPNMNEKPKNFDKVENGCYW